MKKIIPHLRPVLLAMAVGSLCGCSVADIHKMRKDARSEGEQTRRTMPTPAATSPLVWTDSQWINPRPVPVIRPSKPAPSCSITHLRKTGITLQEVAQFITHECRLPVVFTPDTMMSRGSSGETAVLTGSVPVPDNGDALVIPSQNDASTSRSGDTAPPVRLDNLFWQGQLSGFLDLVASRAGLSWRMDNGRVVFYFLETRTYTLAMLNTQTNSSASITSGSTTAAGNDGGNGSSLSGSAVSSQNTTVGQQYDLYSDIRQSIQAMLTPGKGRFWLSSASATLTVTDTPAVQDAVARYVAAQNEVMNRQVSLHVQILNVNTTHNEQFGIDWNLVYNSLNAAGATLNNNAGDIAGAVSGGVSILDTARGQAAKFSGSNLLVNALSQQGDVSVVTSQASTVTNMTPVPLQMADQTGYVTSSSSTTTSGDGGDTSTLETATITTGFNMTMLPLIQAGGNVQLQVALNISDPPTIRHIETKNGNSYVETPSTRVRSLSQKVNLREGQSLILSGFDQRSTDVQLSGTFTPSNPLFGGAQSGKKGRSTMIVIITPTFPSAGGIRHE